MLTTRRACIQCTRQRLHTSARSSIVPSSSRALEAARLEWDSNKRQWIKRQQPSPARRPNNAYNERQRILQELQEQSVNEVNENQAVATPEALEKLPPEATTKRDDTATGSGDVLESSRARYLRGQGSDTLKIKAAKTVAGVPIPIRPLPPESTDCCMSGCPRCVYDVYTEDLQLHFEAMAKARKELLKRGISASEWPKELGPYMPPENQANEVDDDIDGVSAFERASETVSNEIQDLDISLRTFLKFERELRERRRREKALRMAMEHVSSMPSSPPPPSASPSTADSPQATQ